MTKHHVLGEVHLGTKKSYQVVRKTLREYLIFIWDITWAYFMINLAVVPVLYVSLLQFCCFFTVMQRAWRERNPASRIKAAKDALEKNPEWVQGWTLGIRNQTSIVWGFLALVLFLGLLELLILHVLVTSVAILSILKLKIETGVCKY